MSGLSCITAHSAKVLHLGGLLMLLASAACWPGYLRLQLEAPPRVNQGLPLHIVVRAVEPPDYLRDTRISVGNLLAGSDPSVLMDVVLLPPLSAPWRRTLWIKRPEKKSVGVYFLFAAPRGTWKVLLEPPLPLRLRLELAEQSVAPVAGSRGKVLPFL